MANSDVLNFAECLKTNGQGYELVFEIENRLRFFILDIIGSGEKHWWEKFKEKNFVKQVEMVKKSDEGYSVYSIYQIDKKIKNEKKHSGTGFMLMHDIYYTNLMDLHLIIKKHWDEFFKDIIGGKNEKEFYMRLKFVHRVRNKVMHSKPITNDELRELRSFRDYFSNILNQVGKNFDQFLNCFSIDGVLLSFEKELKEHQKRFEGGRIMEQFMTDVCDRSVTEWWWNSKLFLDYSAELMEYYNDVKKANESITSFKNGIATKFSIDSTIHSSRLHERCNKLLNKTLNHS